MPQGDVEVFHQDDEWHIRIEGEQVLPGSYRTKEEAVSEARAIAKDSRAELIIRKQDGTIGQRDSEGRDPRDIPG